MCIFCILCYIVNRDELM